jgi:microsomal dipeptidase-like Zn-dependent dipeptidase
VSRPGYARAPSFPAAVLVDLHAHYPMHVIGNRQPSTQDQLRAWWRRRLLARIVDVISRLANYEGPGDTPSVTEALMREGSVGVTLSVLYWPTSEIDLGQPYGAPPQPGYVDDIVAELDAVEQWVAARSDAVAIAHTPAELDQLLGSAEPLPILIHAIEGGYQLGQNADEVRRNVATLASRGVAYVTVAHLFWRKVATNAPALPFLPDWLYHVAFPQPKEAGLTDLGRATVEAMVREGVLVDITHMSERAIDDTFSLIDQLDPGATVPVIGSHIACRLGKLEYCLTDATIKRIADRGGVLGCILCEHYISDGLADEPKSFDDSFAALARHIDHIRDVTGSHEHVAIGSDLDGYIKPALPGLEHMGRMSALQDALVARYGAVDAERISNGNAQRTLRAGWGRAG